jgi:hypothetical protein
MWTLGRDTVSGNAIHKAFKPEISERKAANILDRLQKLGIAGNATTKQACKVLPASIEELSTDIIDLLNQVGYSDESIEKAFKNDIPNMSGEDIENYDECKEGGLSR